MEKLVNNSPVKSAAEDFSGKEQLCKTGSDGEQSDQKSEEKRTPITTKELIGYAWQIARGMAYLVEMKVNISQV